MSEPKAASRLLTKLTHYCELDEVSGQLLAFLERFERKFSAGESIFASGERIRNLFVVKSGWLFTSITLPDGRRQVTRIYHAGDIIGLPTLAFTHHVMDLEASTDGCICPFAKKDLEPIFERSPKLAAVLFVLCARENVILSDTLRAACRMRPLARLAYFLLHLASSLRITNPTMAGYLELPLTQTVIGDTLGLTNVSVSRALSLMENDGLIRQVRNEVVLLDEQRLSELCDYTDRYAAMDVSWFPGN